MSCSKIGDHLFVINAIINDAIQNNQNIDIQIIDVEKCFDKMNYKETVNDLGSGMTNLLQLKTLLRNAKFL